MTYGNVFSCRCFAVRSTKRLAMWVAVLVPLLGCAEKGLELFEVTGVVTLDGAPLIDAGVVFQPKFGPIATGTTDMQGEFRLQTTNRSGAIAGHHKVTIAKPEQETKYQSDEFGTMGAPLQNKAGQAKPKLPAVYSKPSTTTLTAHVEPSATNYFELDLNSKETK